MVDEENAAVLKEEFRRAVAFRLREARRERTLTQRGMAEIGRSTQQNISRYEKGFIPDSWFLLARLQAEQAIDLNCLLGARAAAGEAAFRPASERRTGAGAARPAGAPAEGAARPHDTAAAASPRPPEAPRTREREDEEGADVVPARRPRPEPLSARAGLAAAGVAGGRLDLAGVPSGREEPDL